jgi:hypothetical protein
MRSLRVGQIIRGMFLVLLEPVFLLRGIAIWLIVLIAASYLTALDAPFADIPSLIASLVAFAAIAVNTHRYILVREAPSPARISSLEGQYVLRSLRVYLPFIIAVFLLVIAVVMFATVSGLDARRFPRSATAAIGVLILLCLGFMVTPRALSLPALAIGRQEFGVAQSSEATDGNGLRLFFLTGIALFVPWCMERLAVFVFALLPSPVPQLAGPIANGIAAAAGAVLWASMLSFAYAGLLEEHPAFSDVVSAQVPEQ